ncbi:DUF968 domain-containing protein [Candidatus Parcubacteria bacterium]|nr:MAG: DUF968 domain-containing protein [Candidatus Parcubacteria bacterium]
MTLFNPQPKQITFISEKYLNFVRSMPCSVCGKMDTEAHHIRFAYNSGTGMKPSDTWAIPLCRHHHRAIHDAGIKTFHAQTGLNIYRELFLVAKRYIEENLK